jgi:hypothetical protein
MANKIFLVLFCIASLAIAQVDVDKTCATCSRRVNDSLNLKVRKVRLNQVGYLPQDTDKSAFIANPTGTTFSIVDITTHKAVHSGPLKSLGAFTEGAMKIRGAFNSVTNLYSFSRPAVSENLYRADFPDFKVPGRYVITNGTDTSAIFQIDPKIYNFVFETSLKFFGSNRCGNTHSWIHGACHRKDGDALGPEFTGKLSGGWHDCGDHGKYSETVAYAAVTLAMTYAFWPQKGEDFYGSSYLDTLPFGTDGIPDVLYEAKIGADFILSLYKVSLAKGLLEKGDMYHSVGMGPGMDHAYWDVPDNQDAQPMAKGGPARPITAGIGSNVAGMYAASLAFFAWGWEPFDPAYAKECLTAAQDIYTKIIVTKRNSSTKMPCCYPGGGQSKDDEGLAALALWYATKDPKYRFDLLENTALGVDNNAKYNQGTFPTGILGNSPFHHGGWTTDYENTHAFVLYGLAKLIVGNPQSAAAYGLSATTADSIKKDCISALYNSILIGSNGSTKVAPGINADAPYHGVFTSADWGYNRYNMGIVTELFMYWDLTGDRAYYAIGIDNLNYNLGMNPWDISFIMGTGEKNLQHPHNRASNPEGYNAGGLPYKYKSPLGALMGGCKPSATLIDDWELYTNTETCIDFSSQFLIPSQMLAMDLPADKDGPKFRNVNIFPEEKSAVVTWTTDEISRDTLFLLDAPGGKLLQTVPGAGLLKNKQITLLGLIPKTTYYIYFHGEDIRHNQTEDKNGGAYWSFTTKASSVPAQISKIRVCNETHESALVTWWTGNGFYSSQVDYGKTTALGLSQSPDDAGIPTQFHRVTLKDLDPASLYYFQALSGTTIDNNSGKYHTFNTTEVLVDYTIRIKPTSKASGGKGTHFYVDVTNHEKKPYTGLELRFYFTGDAATAANLVATGYDNQVFDVGGIPSGLAIEYRKAVQVPGMPDQWYFPIILKSPLPVAGRARFELQINTAANGGNGIQPFSLFRAAWSVRAHASPPDPVVFEGIDLTKGENAIYIGPEMVENVNGENVISYIEDPFITAYYNGVHVFGYGPDYKTDVLVLHRTATLSLTQPVASPVNRLDYRQELGSLTLSGQASSTPGGHIDEIIVNGEVLPESQLTRTGGDVFFTKPMTLIEGTNVFDIIAWDTSNCAVESRKLVVNWKKGPPEPPPQASKPVADPPGKGGRDSIVVGLTSATLGATIWYTLDGTEPVAGGATSVQYTGSLIIKNQVTLKAIAVKANFSPSPILEEKYDVFPFRVANINTTGLYDRNADGYADQIIISLDTSLGTPSLSVLTEQLLRAKLTSGLVLGAFALIGDTLKIDLAANTLYIEDKKEKLTLPPPTTLGDGMLRPGDFILTEAIAPVLRRAILHRGVAGQADTLLTVFSEGFNPAGTLSPLLLAKRIQDGTSYGFTLDGGIATNAATLKSLGYTLRPGEISLLFVVRATLAIGSLLSPTPQAGDSLWINPKSNLGDALGNMQANPENQHVALSVSTPLRFSVESATPGGLGTILKNSQGQPWVVYGGIGLKDFIGEAPKSLPVVQTLPDSKRPGGIVIQTSHPFSLLMRVHDNLGQFVTKVELEVSEREFGLLEPGYTAGTRRLFLLWNGTAENGNIAASGAYVYVWTLVFHPADALPQASAGKRVFGLLREQ